MSQSGTYNDGSVPLGAVETLTGDAGGAVGPDGANNINVLGGVAITTTGNPGTNTLTIDANPTFTGNSGGAVSLSAGGNLNVLGSGSIAVTGNPGTNTLTITNTSFITTVFTSNDTWTKNANTKYLTVYVINGGSGGGSGRRGVSGASSGGGGGAGGLGFFITFPEDYFGASEAVVVGTGGAGGAAQTVNDTNGNNGTEGIISSFAGISFSSAELAPLFGTITYGSGGTNAGGTRGTQNMASYDLIKQLAGESTAFGGGGQVTNGINASLGVNIEPILPTPGGGGAGADSVTERTGGNGANMSILFNALSFASGGAGGVESGTINGSDGAVGALSTTLGTYLYYGTGGGGGGGQSGGASAGNGGNGGFPGGGGGGGGGSLNGTNSGAGGNGADGVVVVVEYLG
jgi:hypothetical protein